MIKNNSMQELVFSLIAFGTILFLIYQYENNEEQLDYYKNRTTTEATEDLLARAAEQGDTNLVITLSTHLGSQKEGAGDQFRAVCAFYSILTLSYEIDDTVVVGGAKYNIRAEGMRNWGTPTPKIIGRN